MTNTSTSRRTSPIYATHDFDGHIKQNAVIGRFDTEEAAREYLLAPYVGAGWDMSTAVIEPSTQYSDCWIKSNDRPRIGASWLAPFSYSQLSVERPGQHPGGQRYWTTPNVPVLVVTEIHEIKED